MVSKEVAQASHAAYQSSNEAAKAKQDSIVANSKQTIADNRGYSYHSQDAEGNIEGAVKGVPYGYDAKTKIVTGTLPSNLRNKPPEESRKIDFDSNSQESYIQRKIEERLSKPSRPEFQGPRPEKDESLSGLVAYGPVTDVSSELLPPSTVLIDRSEAPIGTLENNYGSKPKREFQGPKQPLRSNDMGLPGNLEFIYGEKPKNLLRIENPNVSYFIAGSEAVAKNLANKSKEGIETTKNFVFGTLGFNYGKTKEQQGPTLDNSGVFVGSLSAASENKSSFPLYEQSSKKMIEPRPTFSELFGNNKITNELDKIFELDKPINQRSSEGRYLGIGKKGGSLLETFELPSNRRLAEVLTPFANKAFEAYDTFEATGKSLQGKQGFKVETELGFIPVIKPIKESQKIKSEFDLFKSNDFNNPSVRAGAYGTFLEAAGEFYLFNKGTNAGLKLTDKVISFNIPKKLKNIAIDKGIIKEKITFDEFGNKNPTRAEIKQLINVKKSQGVITDQKRFSLEIKAEKQAWKKLTPNQKEEVTKRITRQASNAANNRVYSRLESLVKKGNAYSIERELNTNSKIDYSVRKNAEKYLRKLHSGKPIGSKLKNSLDFKKVELGSGLVKIIGPTFSNLPKFDYYSTKGGGKYTRPFFNEPEAKPLKTNSKTVQIQKTTPQEFRFVSKQIQLGRTKNIKKVNAKPFLDSLERSTRQSSSLDNLFSKAKKTKRTNYSELEGLAILYPQQTPQKIKQPSIVKNQQLNDITKTPQIQIPRQPQIQIPRQKPKQENPFKIIPSPKIKQTQEQKQPLIIIPRQPQIQIPRQPQIPKLIIEQTPILKQPPYYPPILKQPPYQPPTIKQPPFKFPPTRNPPFEPPFRPKLGFPFFAPGFFGSSGFGTPASSKTVFSAYGISEDINIKTLPTWSRYSQNTSIFKAQSNEDKRIQALFYGKPKKRSRKSKGKSKKR